MFALCEACTASASAMVRPPAQQCPAAAFVFETAMHSHDAPQCDSVGQEFEVCSALQEAAKPAVRECMAAKHKWIRAQQAAKLPHLAC